MTFKPPRARALILLDSGAVAYSAALAAYDGTEGGQGGTPTPSPTPTFNTAPAIVDTPRVGHQLSALAVTDGVVANGSVSARSFFLAGSAVASTYVLLAADVGKQLVYRNAATGPGGNASADSAAVTVAAALAYKLLQEGDSITAFSQSNGGWPSYARLWAAAHSSLTISNTAVGGSSLGYPTDAAGTLSLYGRLANDQAYNPTHMSVFIGANDDISGTYFNRLMAYVKIFRDAGVIVFVGTVLSRKDSAVINASRGTFNASLRAAVGTKIDGVFDFDTLPVGADGACNDVTLFADGIHPTAAAQGTMQQVYAVEVNWQLGIPNEPLDFAYAPTSGAPADSDVTSAAYTVEGLHAGESRPYQAAAGVYVSKNGGAYVLAGSGTVVNGDTLRVRARSSANAAGQINAALTIGTTTATFTITTAGAGSRDWVPTDLGAKLAMWVKPETLGDDRTAVTLWADQSGKGNDLVVETGGGSGRPTVGASAINGLKAVHFDPTQTAWLKAPATLLDGAAAMATFFVSKNAVDPNTASFGAPIGNFGTEGGDYWTYQSGGIYTGYGTNVRHDDMKPPSKTDSYHQYMLSSAPNDWRIAQDGTDFGVFTSNTVSPGTAPKIGRSPGIGSSFDGFVGEIVHVNTTLTTAERQLVEGYLAWKFGLQANLPANHPYKAAKPTTSG